MIRPIKFRAWDKRGAKIVSHIDGDMMNILCPSDLSPEWYDLMQFTGLLDKNGEEIYEGDIVRGVYEDVGTDGELSIKTKMCGKVFYDHHGFSLEVIEEMCDEDRIRKANYFDFMQDDGGMFREMVVIGNIYENSELLK